MTRTLNISRASIAVFAVLLVVGMTLPLGTVAQSQEEDEPNDAQEAATVIEGTSISGEIIQKGDSDWFATEFTAGETASFTVTKSIRDSGLKMSLYAPNGSVLNETAGYHGVGKLQISAPADESGKYYTEIEAIATKNHEIPYTVHTPADEAPPKKRSTESVTGTQQENEPNDKEPNPLTGEEITGKIDSENDTDWYMFQANEGQNISILLTKNADEQRVGVGVHKPDRIDDPSATDYFDVKRGEARSQEIISIRESGMYYIEVDRGRTTEGKNNYTIQFTGEDLPIQPGESADSEGTSSESTNEDGNEESTSLFGPGFTGGGAVVALFITALFALRRQ